MLNSIKKEYLLLFIIFCAVFGTRLYFAFQTEEFSPRGYFEERQIQHILDTGLPMIYDELSYSGRDMIVSPVYYYLMALFSAIVGIDISMRVVPNLLISLLVFIIFFIVKDITKSNFASLYSSFFVGFIPILASATLLSAPSESLAFPIIFLSLYFFMNLHEEKNLNYFITTILVLPFIAPVSLTILMSFIFYFVFMNLDNVNINKMEVEASLFAILFMTLAYFVQFKEALIYNGADIIWQNIPEKILNEYFIGVDVLSYVVAVGIIPLIFGIYTIYMYTFKINNPKLYLFIGFSASLFLLLWLKFIRPEVGLSLIGITLIILSGEGLRSFNMYLKETKLAKSHTLIFSLILIVFIFTSVNNTIASSENEVNNVPDDNMLGALDWLKVNAPANSIVLSKLEYGHLITGIAGHRNVLDDNFILIESPDIILDDVDNFLEAKSVVDSVKILNKYNVDYLLLPKEKYKFLESNNNCFRKKYSNEQIVVYESLCKVEEIA
ncbi:MAG: hypothetical protein WC471_05650 [Candidatus Woesearchaeota archaeon]